MPLDLPVAVSIFKATLHTAEGLGRFRPIRSFYTGQVAKVVTSRFEQPELSVTELRKCFARKCVDLGSKEENI